MWATRAGCHVDRAACAWLIRRFIDPDAMFVFVDDPAEVPEGAIPFDMRGADLSHHGDDCTFETILRRRELDDPVLWDVARIVHEADLADERYDAPEAPGLDVLLRGLSMVQTDEEILAISGRCSTGSTSTEVGRSSSGANRRDQGTGSMIVCWRTVYVPQDERQRFGAWIQANRRIRERHGILFELVLERSPRQNPGKTLQPAELESAEDRELVVVTAWGSHDTFDAWIDTPDRDRLTDSEVHRSVRYGPITRYDVVGGYLNLDGLSAVAESLKEERP